MELELRYSVYYTVSSLDSINVYYSIVDQRTGQVYSHHKNFIGKDRNYNTIFVLKYYCNVFFLVISIVQCDVSFVKDLLACYRIR